MEEDNKLGLICGQINKKGTLKMNVYKNTDIAFATLKEEASKFPSTYRSCHSDSEINVKYDNPQPQVFLYSLVVIYFFLFCTATYLSLTETMKL